MTLIKPLSKDRRYRIASVLALIWAISLYHFGFSYAFLSVATAVIVACGLDFLINQIIRKLVYFPISGLVSGLLVGLIISPTAGPLPLLGGAVLAVLSKHILTWKTEGLRRHIFNPASFGIIVTSLLFGNQAAWWAVAWWPQFYLVLIPTAGYVIFRLGRGPLAASFLGVYFLYIAVTLGNPLSALSATLDSTVLMFALIMLPEPQSSPASGRWKYGFGVLVGLLVIVSGLCRSIGPDPLLLALLSANLVAFVLNYFLPRLTK